jgi:hypothetical protein
LALEVGSLGATSSKLRGVQVHDRPAQVDVEGVGDPKVGEAADDSHERVLDEVFGQVSICHQQERQTPRGRRVTLVQLREPVLAWSLPLGVRQLLGHLGVQDRPHTYSDAHARSEVAGLITLWSLRCASQAGGQLWMGWIL